MMTKLKKFYSENGYLHLKNFIGKDIVLKVLIEAKSVFLNQFLVKGYTKQSDVTKINLEDFDNMMFRLFEEDIQVLSNCGKQAQHLISLHQLSLNEKLISLLREMGMSFPNISTRPVLYFNHPRLAREKVFYKVDAHQDWRSMQGSLNSIVIWVPLIDINKDLGALEIMPYSHILGLLTKSLEKGFGMVDLTENEKSKFISVEVEAGDILLFSSFLVHQSGENISSTPRWSCHFRYNDLNESTFIERGYPHAYIYKPVEELITPNFPKEDQLNSIFQDGL